MLSLLLTKCWRNSSRTRLNGSVKWHNFWFSYALKYGHCYFFLDLLDKDIGWSWWTNKATRDSSITQLRLKNCNRLD